MARVPLFQENQRLSIQTPTRAVNPVAARIKGETLSSAGSTVLGAAGVGFGLQQRYKNRIKKENEDAAIDSILKNERESVNEAVKFGKFDKNGDSDINDLYLKNSDSFFNKALAGAPEESKTRIQSAFRKMRQDSSDYLQRKETALGWKEVQGLRIEKEKKRSAMIQQDPALASTYAKTFLLEDEEAFKDLNVNSVQKDKMIRDAKNIYAQSAIDGYVQKGMLNVGFSHEGLAALRASAGEDVAGPVVVTFSAQEAAEKGFITKEEAENNPDKPYEVDVNQISKPAHGAKDMSALLKNLSPAQRDAAMKTLQGQIKTKERKALSDLGIETRNGLSFVMSGKEGSKEEASKLIGRWMVAPGISENSRARKTLGISAAYHAGQKIKEFGTKHPALWEKDGLEKSINAAVKDMSKISPAAAKMAKNRPFMDSLKKEIKSQMAREETHAMTERNKRAFDYSLENNPDLASLHQMIGVGKSHNPKLQDQFNDAMYEWQLSTGVAPSNIQLISPRDGLQLGMKIISTGDPSVINMQLEKEIQEKHGKNAGIVLGDLIEQGSLPASFSNLFQMSNAVARTEVLSNATTAKNDEEFFKKKFTSKSDRDLLDAAVFESLEGHINAAGNASVKGNSKIGLSFISKVREASINAANKPGVTTEDFKKITNEAKQRLIESNWTVPVQENGQGLLFPRVSMTTGKPTNHAIMQGFFDLYSSTDNLSKIVGDTGLAFEQGLRDSGMTDSREIRQLWLREIVEEGTWIEVKGRYHLRYKGSPVHARPTIIDGKRVALPISLTYEEISANQDVLDQTRNFGEDLTEFFGSEIDDPKKKPFGIIDPARKF